MAEPLILSIDVGTTSVKASLLRAGKQVATVSESYPHKASGEIDPKRLLSAVDLVIDRLSKRMVPDLFILTTAMHSLLVMEPAERFLTPIYTWEHPLGTLAIHRQPQRTLTEQYLATGTPIHPMNVSLKLKDLKQKGALSSATKILSIKDLLMWHLTGEWVIDAACAAATGLVAIHTGQWHVKLLQDLGIPLHALPKIVPMAATFAYRPTSIGEISTAGLPRYDNNNVAVMIGTSDGASANGVFLDLGNPLVISLGTSHAVRTISEQPLLDPAMQNFAYYLAEKQYLMGLPSNNGGNVLAWLTAQFDLSFSKLKDVMTKNTLPEAVFLPYLNGERSPLWQMQAQGGWRLLTAKTTHQDLIASVVWGLFSNVRMNVERMTSLVGIQQVGVAGGVAASASLMQALTDLLGIPIQVPRTPHAETIGTLKLLGLQTPSLTYRTYTPNPAKSEQLQHYYQRFLAQVAGEYTDF
ncbi:MAG: FGGY family carbohydrate kinase [Aerococcus sp.]|nr:FGGY family carbohydrate kinase [Aerococcus sp.]